MFSVGSAVAVSAPLKQPILHLASGIRLALTTADCVLLYAIEQVVADVALAVVSIILQAESVLVGCWLRATDAGLTRVSDGSAFRDERNVQAHWMRDNVLAVVV